MCSSSSCSHCVDRYYLSGNSCVPCSPNWTAFTVTHHLTAVSAISTINGGMEIAIPALQTAANVIINI